MLPFVSRRRYEAELDQLHALEEKARRTARLRDQAVIAELTKQKAALQAQITTYARTLSAQDDTVRLHLARIELLQRSLTDATTTTESWAEDRKEALDRIAELEHDLASLEKLFEDYRVAAIDENRAALKALGESRARYGDLEARLAPADAENVGLVQARIRRLIEVLWASRRAHQWRREALEYFLYGEWESNHSEHCDNTKTIHSPCWRPLPEVLKGTKYAEADS